MNDRKTSKLLQLIGLIGIVIIFISCGKKNQSIQQTEIPKDWKSLENSDYSIQYPDTFELNTSGEMGLSFILLSKQTSQLDPFRENINLIEQDLTNQNINLDKFMEISIGQIKTMFNNASIIESKRVINGNYEFHKITYSATQGQFNLQFVQYCWIIDQKAYVLTFTSEQNQFDNYIKIGEKIMNTFKIK